jgi:hypothetical protein
MCRPPAPTAAIGTQVAQLSGNLPQYQTTIETKIAGLRNAMIDKLSRRADCQNCQAWPAMARFWIKS